MRCPTMSRIVPDMADSFTKVWGSILDSSVWGEPHYVRIVWITMLAMADQHGYVGASVGGIARRANVAPCEAEEALEVFQRPDPDSRNEAHEGRRIEKVERGWHLLNYAYFRDLRDKEQRRAYEADRKRKYRAKTKGQVPDKS